MEQLCARSTCTSHLRRWARPLWPRCSRAVLLASLQASRTAGLYSAMVGLGHTSRAVSGTPRTYRCPDRPEILVQTRKYPLEVPGYSGPSWWLGDSRCHRSPDALRLQPPASGWRGRFQALPAASSHGSPASPCLIKSLGEGESLPDSAGNLGQNSRREKSRQRLCVSVPPQCGDSKGRRGVPQLGEGSLEEAHGPSARSAALQFLCAGGGHQWVIWLIPQIGFSIC